MHTPLPGICSVRLFVDEQVCCACFRFVKGIRETALEVAHSIQTGAMVRCKVVNGKLLQIFAGESKSFGCGMQQVHASHDGMDVFYTAYLLNVFQCVDDTGMATPQQHDQRCQPWRAKRRLVDPSSREAALFSRRALRQRENKVGLRTRRPVIWEPSTEQQRACEVVA